MKIHITLIALTFFVIGGYSASCSTAKANGKPALIPVVSPATNTVVVPAPKEPLVINNLPQLKTDIKTAFGNDLDATTIQKLRDRFVSAYPSQWQNYLTTNSLTDTAANRNNFAIEMVFAYMQAVYQGESMKANMQALPTPDTIQE